MCTPGASGAGAGERPYVSGVTVHVADERLVFDVSCGGLFSEQIAGTVKSGLPAVVELLFSLEEDGGNTVANGLISYELQYDVWDDVYYIRAGDSVESFDTFDGFKNAIEHIGAVPVAPVGRIDRSRAHTVHVTVAVHPLSGSDRRRIAGFVEEAVGARSHDSWREQVLNINDLIGWFFSRDKGTSNRSDVFETSAFTLDSLPGAGHSPGGKGQGAPADLIVAIEVR
jgi:hypothetical protein